MARTAADLPPVDFEFREEFTVTLPAHQWQLLLRGSFDAMLAEAGKNGDGLAQAYHEIAMEYKRAKASRRG